MPYKIDIIAECRYCSNFAWEPIGLPEKWCFKLKRRIENPFLIPKECQLKEYDINKDINEVFDGLEKLKRYAETKKFPATEREIDHIKLKLSKAYERYLEADDANKDKMLSMYEGAKEIASLWITDDEIKEIEKEGNEWFEVKDKE